MIHALNKTAKIPYAYKASEHDPLVLIPDEKKASLVEEAMDYLEEGPSTRKTAEWLGEKTGDKISHQGLIHIWKTLEKLPNIYQHRTSSGMQWHGIQPVIHL